MGVFNKLELPCIHLGPPTGEVRDCAACGGKKAVPVFACAKYGRCSPGDRLVYREEGRNVEVQWCRTCPDYENPLAPVPEPAQVLAGVAHPSMLDLDKMHLYRRNPDGSVPMETHFPGIMQTRPDGSIHWLSPPQQRPAMLTMMEARAAGLSPLGAGPGADPNCNGCQCGGTTVGPCCNCQALPSNWKVTLSTITNGNNLDCLNCLPLNSTHTLGYAGAGSCTWFEGGTNACIGDASQHICELTCVVGPPITWTLTFIGVAGIGLANYTTPAASWTCNGTNTMSLTAGSVDPACGGWPSTVTISPA